MLIICDNEQHIKARRRVCLQIYVQKVQQRDELDNEVAKRYAHWRKLAIGLERDVVRGEDLLSETLLKIFDRHRDAALDVTRRGKLDEYVRRSMYLMKIGKYTKFAIKYKRFATMWSCEVNTDVIEPEPPFIGARLDNEYIDAYISLMPELDAVILRLYAMPDFKYDNVAKETGIPKRTLYKLVESAIKKIRENVQTQRPSTGESRED